MFDGMEKKHLVHFKNAKIEVSAQNQLEINLSWI